MPIVRRLRPAAILGTLLLAFGASLVRAASGDDGISLQCSKGPAAGNVSLQWAGGAGPFSIFRSTTPSDVTTPLSFLGTSAGGSWTDTPPSGGIHFYYVEGECTYNPPELCNGIDDDCDPGTPDGSQDPRVGASCDGPDTDLCKEGIGSCLVGSIACDDATSGTPETCNGDAQDENCDGAVDEGFLPVDTNPACAQYQNLGSLAGDLGTGALFTTGFAEAWIRVNLTERNEGVGNLTATISLSSPPGSDFDLYVRCLGCSGNTGGWSFQRGLDGHIDATFIRKDDDPDRIDTFPVLIEVRNYASSYCGTWTLLVQSNTGAPYETCFTLP